VKSSSFTSALYSYVVAVDFSKILSSNNVNLENAEKSRGSVQFCAQVSTKLNDDDLIITSKKTNVSLKFDLTSVELTEVVYNFAAETVQAVEQELENAFKVEVCLCNKDTAGCVTPSPIPTNAESVLCLKPSDDSVKIVNFSMMVKNGSFQYNPVSIGANAYIIANSDLTSVKSVGNNLVVTMFMVADLLLKGDGTAVTLSGVANLSFTGSKSAGGQPKRNYSFFEVNFEIMADDDVDASEPGCSTGNFLRGILGPK